MSQPNDPFFERVLRLQRGPTFLKLQEPHNFSEAFKSCTGNDWNAVLENSVMTKRECQKLGVRHVLIYTLSDMKIQRAVSLAYNTKHVAHPIKSNSLTYET